MMDVLVAIAIFVGSLSIIALILVINILWKIRSFIDAFASLPDLTPAEVKQMNMVNEDDEQ